MPIKDLVKVFDGKKIQLVKRSVILYLINVKQSLSSDRLRRFFDQNVQQIQRDIFSKGDWWTFKNTDGVVVAFNILEENSVPGRANKRRSRLASKNVTGSKFEIYPDNKIKLIGIATVKTDELIDRIMVYKVNEEFFIKNFLD